MGSEWPTVRLGDAVELKRGYDLAKARRRTGTIPIVSSSGISGRHDESKVSPPGVVTGRYGTIGQVFYIEEPFWPLNTTLYVRDFRGNDPRFVSYLLETVDFASCADKAAVPGVNRNHLHQLPIQLPSLDEQRRIASILGALDDKIELNRRMSRTLDEIAQAIFKSWFVDPVRDGLTEGWEELQVSDLADLNATSLAASEPLGSLRYVEISAVRDGVIDEAPTYSRADAPGRARRRLRHGDTVLSTVRPNRRAYFLALDPPSDMIASTGFVTLSPKSVPWAWLHAAMSRDLVFRRLGDLADGGAYPAVSAKLVGALQVALPVDRRAVDDFQELCAPFYKRAASLRVEATTLAELRDTLLPRLISGELSVT